MIYVPDDQIAAYTDALQGAYYNVTAHIQPSGKNAVVREALDNENWFSFDASTGYSQYHAFVEVPASIDGVRLNPLPAKPSGAIIASMAESTAAPAVPVGEAGAAYIGKWSADTLEMDGEVYPIADMGMEMYFTLNVDGTAESYDGKMTESSTWTVENGLVVLEGMAMAPDAPVEAAAEEEAGFVGTWYGCYMATGVMNGNPREIFEIILTVNADGTANLAYPTDEPWRWTENADGSLLMVKDSDGTEMPLNRLDEQFICYGSMDGDGNAYGGYIIFSRDAQAVWTPDMLPLQEEAVAEANVDASAELSERMEIRYVRQSADADGVTLDAALLGGEYALTFHADGTMDFVMVGNAIPGLKWTQGDNSFIIDYYGTTLEAVLTENGLDLNYFDTMMMHFVPVA